MAENALGASGWVNSLRNYLKPEPGDTYGNILPLARDGETNALRLSLPMMARDAVNNLAFFADAPRAAYAGEIDPMDRATQERLAQGVFEMGAGGMAARAVPTDDIARGAVRYYRDESGVVRLMGGGTSDPTKTGWTFKDVNGNIGLTKGEEKMLSEGAKMPRTELVPIRSLYAMQDKVNPDFATTETSSGMLPNVVRKNGKLFLQDGHHRATRVAEEGGQNVRVNLFDFDNVDTSTPLLEYDYQKEVANKLADEQLLAELFGSN